MAQGPEVRRTISTMRYVLFVASALVLIIGLPQFAVPGKTHTFFSWTVNPPLTAAFLGGAYLAAFLLEATSARKRVWAHARIAVPSVFVFTTLTLVVTFIHRDKFHFRFHHRLVALGHRMDLVDRLRHRAAHHGRDLATPNAHPRNRSASSGPTATCSPHLVWVPSNSDAVVRDRSPDSPWINSAVDLAMGAQCSHWARHRGLAPGTRGRGSPSGLGERFLSPSERLRRVLRACRPPTDRRSSIRHIHASHNRCRCPRLELTPDMALRQFRAQLRPGWRVGQGVLEEASIVALAGKPSDVVMQIVRMGFGSEHRVLAFGVTDRRVSPVTREHKRWLG
jgi:hypothetical protein